VKIHSSLSLVDHSIRSRSPVIFIMDFDSRSKRTVKRKVIYSPSEPLGPEYHLIHVQELQKDFIVKKSSVKQQPNGKIYISVAGKEKQGDLITSGMSFSSFMKSMQWMDG
jgi:hypothetical protein